MTIKIPAKKVQESTPVQKIKKRSHNSPCIRLPRIDQYEQFIRVNRREAREAYDNDKNIYLTVCDDNPENGTVINKAYEFDTFDEVLEVFEKHHSRNGTQWTTIWLEFED